MLDFNPHKHNCTGCSACYSACPVSCITMKEDSEGFLYPIANQDNCVHCGLCEKVCPIINPIRPNLHDHQVYAALTKSRKIWRDSASGGAFSEICSVWSDDNTLIIGAAWDNNTVHHLSVKGPSQIAPLRKSKYLASRLEDTFQETLAHLNKGGKVVFSGTPCQIAGLRSYLRKDNDNLLLIDLICHGVGSPKVFNYCLKSIEKQAGKRLSHYEFRAKRFFFETEYLSKVSFVDGSSEYIVKDQYSQLFLRQTCLRPSCGANCAFRGKNIRQGDLTIADCKGLTSSFPQLLGTKRNFSTIVSNTRKGDSVLELLHNRMFLLSYSLDDVIKYNPLFDHQTWLSTDRDIFFDEFKNNNEATIERWTSPYQISRMTIKGFVFGHLPMGLRRFFLVGRRSIH